MGRASIREILSSGRIKELINGASTLGLFMMGALSSNYVALSSPLKFTFGKGNEPFVVQNIIDSIVPGLPLLAVLGIYWWLNKKNQNMVAIMLIILAISLIGAITGIL